MTESRRGLLTVTVLTAAAFGPYVADGLRTEQVAVYVAAALMLPFASLTIRGRGAGALVLAWVALAAVGLMGVLAPVAGEGRWAQGSPVAGLDNLLLPVATSLVVLSLLAWGADRLLLLRRVSAVLVVAMLVNVAAAVLQSRGVVFAAWQPSGAESVSARAAAQFRYSGLINQPAEAGLLYGMALIAATYLLWKRPALLMVVAAVLSYGGVLTVSKVFLLVSLPIFGWQILKPRGDGSSRRVGAVVVATFVGLGAYSQGLLPRFEGIDQLLAIIPGVGESAVSSLTASRLGDSSTLEPVMREVLNVSPLSGFGAQGLRVAYDNGWVEALVVAGLLGVLAYTAALVAILMGWRGQPRSAERAYLGCLLVLLAGASVGLPALTANRAATVAWLLVTLLMAWRPAPVAGSADLQVRQWAPRTGRSGSGAHPARRSADAGR